MAKPFGKLPADFLKTQRTKDFIAELTAMKNIIATDLVIVKNGGSDFGSWMHKIVQSSYLNEQGRLNFE